MFSSGPSSTCSSDPSAGGGPQGGGVVGCGRGWGQKGRALPGRSDPQGQLRRTRCKMQHRPAAPCQGAVAWPAALPAIRGPPRPVSRPGRIPGPRRLYQPTCADDRNLEQLVTLNIQPCHLAVNPHQRLLQPWALPLALPLLSPRRCRRAAVAGGACCPPLLLPGGQLCALRLGVGALQRRKVIHAWLGCWRGCLSCWCYSCWWRGAAASTLLQLL